MPLSVLLLGSLLSFLHASAPPAREPPAELASFPRSSLVIESGRRRHRFEVWVADTQPRRARGLMFVKALPENTGMLFLFGEPQPVSMWMKDTFISLDMLFVAFDGRVIRIAERTRPHSLESIPSGEPASAVLEIAGGESARLGLKAGDRIRHRAFTAP